MQEKSPWYLVPMNLFSLFVIGWTSSFYLNADWLGILSHPGISGIVMVFCWGMALTTLYMTFLEFGRRAIVCYLMPVFAAIVLAVLGSKWLLSLPWYAYPFLYLGIGLPLGNILNMGCLTSRRPRVASQPQAFERKRTRAW